MNRNLLICLSMTNILSGMRQTILWFMAARHYASLVHWDDVYAYVLRSRPDNIPQHEDTYNRNAQAWHYTNVRLNELIQEAEQALEAGDRQLTQGIQFGPPRNSLIPTVRSTGTPSPVRSIQEEGSPDVISTGGTGRSREQGEKPFPKSPLSPDKKSQREERNSVIDAVKQIIGALRDTPTQEEMSIGGTPEYDCDTRYDGIQGFPSHLKNRVSEPSTPRGDNHLGGDPECPPNHKGTINN